MPGILPMKVIKVGSSSQSRIAQACDRCRSKKIRCDGIRPTCSQCDAVGFECRTSDRLSRRAFPRGYTESLEERVRVLENEVNELKDLLDSKDEKIDMLSKMHSHQHHMTSIPAESPGSNSSDHRKDANALKEDTFRVQPSPLLLGVENSDSYFMGHSSGRAFIETLKRKIQGSGKTCSDFNPEAFLNVQGCQPLLANAADQPFKAPPRLFSDKCVNVYFQEWAPLFPILHKPTFLHAYEEFVADPDKVKSNYKIAQLYLVFNIAGLTVENPDYEQLAACERQWTRAVDSILMETTMNTMQCLLLALLYCTVRADYRKVQHYKALAVSLSHRLGLHQCQKRFTFGSLTIETRKKVFWTLYTLDCFTAGLLGLPKLLKEDDIQTEYPADVDDEYVNEKGFMPTLPGEHTRLSSALALIRASRILSRVLEKLYPTAAPYELSLQQMNALEAELDTWYESLPSHLRLNFVQDKPSTDVTGSRSPLLALAFYYIRTLIYRPAVGSSLGVKAAHALLCIADSSKHIVQIVELLDERRMSFSFCMNRSDLLMLCGMALLYQTVGLSKDSRLMRDNERLVNSVLKMIFRAQAPGSVALRRIASMLVSVEGSPEPQVGPKKSRDRLMPAPPHQTSPPAEFRRSRPSPLIGCRVDGLVSESDLLRQQEKLRLMANSMSAQRPHLHRARSRQSFDNYEHHESLAQREHRMSMSQIQPTDIYGLGPNLDYLSLSTNQPHSQHSSPEQSRMLPPSLPQKHPQSQISQSGMKPTAVSDAEWETLLGTMDGGLANVYDAIYGGSSLINEATMPTNSTTSEWSPDAWDLSSISIADVGPDDPPARSVQSFSDESLSSGEEVAPSDLGLSVTSVDYHGQMMSNNCATYPL